MQINLQTTSIQSIKMANVKYRPAYLHNTLIFFAHGTNEAYIKLIFQGAMSTTRVKTYITVYGKTKRKAQYLYSLPKTTE